VPPTRDVGPVSLTVGRDTFVTLGFARQKASHLRASFAVKQQIKRLGFVTVEQGVRARLLAIGFELPPFGSAAEFFALFDVKCPRRTLVLSPFRTRVIVDIPRRLHGIIETKNENSKNVEMAGSRVPGTLLCAPKDPWKRWGGRPSLPAHTSSIEHGIALDLDAWW
jgi:hypothetical protein